jgi:hypothetical protein
MLIVVSENNLNPRSKRIVIPRSLVHGIVTALRLKLLHPSKEQLKIVMERSFFALQLSKVIELVHANCDVCSSLQDVPTKSRNNLRRNPQPLSAATSVPT